MLLTTRQVLDITGLTRNKLYRLRDRGRFPAAVEVLNTIGYRLDDIERWMQGNVSARFHFDQKIAS